MKDYYYFLGVPRDASADDIRRAYRQLSLKYHPDRNDNDQFFARRFQEAQEAYDTLSAPQSRKLYDSNFESVQKSSRNSLPPYIKTFTASKIRVKKGNEIVLNWQTNNADLVKILPFGLEKPYGERTFRITEFQNGQFHVVLQATNTLINKSVVQGITFTEVFENDTEKFKNDVEEFFRPQPRTTANPQGRQKALIWMMLTILLTVLLIVFFNQ